MEAWLNDYLSGYRTAFFVNQTLAIVMLFVAGFLFMLLVKREAAGIFGALLYYPLGLSLYTLAGVILLTADIKLNRRNMITTVLILLALSYAISIVMKAIASGRLSMSLSWFAIRLPGLKPLLIVLFVAVLTACLSCTGIFSVIISQDSMYRYSLYPEAIVRYKHLRREFNVFLTDVGLGGAVIGTLPYLFGFNETFGIQTALNLDFLAVFGFAVREARLRHGKKDEAAIMGRSLPEDIPGNCRKNMGVYIALSLFILITSMPFTIMSKWAISNMYFMEFLFICTFTSVAFKEEGRKENIIILSALTIMLSSLRMEGMIYVLLLMLFYAAEKAPQGLLIKQAETSASVKPMTDAYPGALLSNLILLPCFFLYGLYYYRISFMDIDAPYTFLTPQKAMLQLAAIGLLYIFLCIKKMRFFAVIDRHLKAMILAGLLAVNVLLLIMDRELYITDIKAYYYNLTHQSGWGVFPVFCIAAAAILLFLVLTEKKDRPDAGIRYVLSDMDFLVLSYLLVTLVAGFARGDALQENIGDSGNRILMQMVPLTVYAIMEHFSEHL